jgi:glucose/arabinose dehydrogenase
MVPKALKLAPAFLLLACQNAPAGIALQQAFPNISFVNPVDFQHPGDGTNRLFVVEQRGIIHVFENKHDVDQKSVFLDIQERVDDSGMEEGLLGLAFHPDFEKNRYFYVNYTSTNPDRSRISRFRVSKSNPDVADPESELIVLEVDKPYENHNAGQLVFGPSDGYLYVPTGDGGSGGDPHNNGQNLKALLGKILRIDVNRTDSGLHYAIPPDNPFANNTQGYRKEIFAYGMRNPWRISFDPETGRLWAADVGQNKWEEIDIIQSGKNYGWRTMEGRHCYNPPEDCDTTGLTMPVWEYGRSQGISATGGYVYRGPGVSELTGKYVYADFGSGRIWSLAYDGQKPPSNALLLDTSLQISSFGVDRLNELYVCAFDGKIYKFTEK